MWHLAIKAMLGDRSKLLVSLLGVSFAVVLVNLQAGLLVGLIQKASLLVDHGGADIWVGCRSIKNVDVVSFIPERWLQRIRGVEGVERAEPYLVMFSTLTLPDGRFESVQVVGCDPAGLLGNAWNMTRGRAEDVRRPDAIIVDVCDAEKLGYPRIGDVREINGHRARIVGQTEGIVGFTTNPYVFTTLEQARTKYSSGVAPGHYSYFLVKAKSGSDIAALAGRIRQRVPELDVYDRDAYSRQCMEYWLTRTGVGISFGLAALLGLLVGLAVVAQTLYASVTERAKEFGTLKALGADDGCVARFLLAQALGNAVIGSVLGLTFALVLGHAITSPRAPVVLTVQAAALSMALVTGVCLLAAWLPYWRLKRIEPASVLRS
jgi:putative ABC transport system permease protein